VRVGRRTRVRVRVTARGRPLAAAAIRIGRRRARTDRHGRAVLRVRFAHAGSRFVRVHKSGYRDARVALTVAGRASSARRPTVDTR
jgi:hypothetical protein